MSALRMATVAALGLALVVQGCTGNDTSQPLFTLEASADVGFACVKRVRSTLNLNTIIDETLVPLSYCEAHNLSEGATNFPSPDPCMPPETEEEDETTDCELQALVTQLFTGEVAGINLTVGGGVADLSVQVPGATFVSAGERPSAIAVWDEDSRFSFVANFGSKTVQSLDTEVMLDLMGATPDEGGGEVLNVVEGPVDLAISENGFFLYAALKADGTVLQMLINPFTGDFVGPDTSLSLDGTATQVQAPELGADNDYYRYCQPDRGPRTVTVQPRTPTDDTVPALPNKLTIDRVDSILLVADAGRPFIHRFQLDSSGVVGPLDPINVGVPTTDVVVTPYMPSAVFPPGDIQNALPNTRYLYAIDATDGSVLVVDYAADSPTFGAVLPVSSGDVPDRIDLRTNGTARSLAVVTPDYDPDTINDDLCVLGTDDAAQASPAFLRGVFVAVAISDANVTFIDVFDLDATCRGGTLLTCDDPPISSDVVVSIRRSRPHIGNLVTVDLDITSGPSLRFRQSAGNVDDVTGSIDDPLAPSLEDVPCDFPARSLFPDADEVDETVFICGNDEPWVAPSQRWDAIWEGPIPFAEGTFGAAEKDGDENWFVARDALFCLWGVVGETNATGLAPPAAGEEYIGDQLVITGDIPDDLQLEAEMMPNSQCAKFLENSENFEDEPVAFPILESFMGELQLGESLDPARYTFDDVLACFDDSVAYAVLTREVYAVVGGATGFLHRVTTADPSDPTSPCFVDPPLPVDPSDPRTLLNGRAFPGVQFENPYIRFKIGQFPQFPEPIPVTDEVFLTFTTNNRTADAKFFTGLLPNGQRVISLPETVIYSSLDEYVYLADVSAGFGIIQLQPQAWVRYFR